MSAKELKYSSGETIIRGDRISYNGENGEVDSTITEESPDWNSFQEILKRLLKVGNDYFEDRTSFEKRYCARSSSIQFHRILSRWGIKPSEGRKLKTRPSSWKYEREIAAHCGQCFSFLVEAKK
jgi:hypothetical protein